MLTNLFPKNPILRGYILGVATGMGAACAYLYGLARWQEKKRAYHAKYPGYYPREEE